MPYHITPDDRKKIAKSVSRYTVDDSNHDSFGEGHCVMELVSHYLPSTDKNVCVKTVPREEEHTDDPFHSDASLTSVMIAVNDAVSGDNRQLLKKLVPWLVGSKTSVTVSERRMTLLNKAFIDRLLSKLDREVCCKVCAVPKLFEKGQTAEAVKIIEKVMKEYRYKSNMVSTNEILRKISNIVNVFSCDCFDHDNLVVNSEDFDAEEENLKFFIKTVLNILQTT